MVFAALALAFGTPKHEALSGRLSHDDTIFTGQLPHHEVSSLFPFDMQAVRFGSTCQVIHIPDSNGRIVMVVHTDPRALAMA